MCLTVYFERLNHWFPSFVPQFISHFQKVIYLELHSRPQQCRSIAMIPDLLILLTSVVQTQFYTCYSKRSAEAWWSERECELVNMYYRDFEVFTWWTSSRISAINTTKWNTDTILIYQSRYEATERINTGACHAERTSGR